ncbi:MAG: protein-L-isoaspartate(D-aspartate) O-methyltransferase [Chloroflexota bacterium]
MDTGRPQLEMLRQLERFGIRDQRVLAAMARVPREEFVSSTDRDVAYGDHALAIDEGQTISQPYVVARMTELLATQPEHRVLEVGTGSGYQAAVLAELVREVISIERHAALADAARERLERLGYSSVRVIRADASLGYPPEAPYDRILVTAATPRIDPALADQLTSDGLIVAPVGDLEKQDLIVRDTRGREERHGHVRFVPLRGEAGFRA